MDLDHDVYEKAFLKARGQAVRFIDRYNSQLPTKACPACSDDGHVPGLCCPACGYVHSKPWLILRDTEFGYEARQLTKGRVVIAKFDVEGC